jgi:hypothetical protein
MIFNFGPLIICWLLGGWYVGRIVFSLHAHVVILVDKDVKPLEPEQCLQMQVLHAALIGLYGELLLVTGSAMLDGVSNAVFLQ